MQELTETVKSLMRPFIAFSFVMGTIILYLVDKIESQSILQTTGIIVGFYFGERAALKKPTMDQ